MRKVLLWAILLLVVVVAGIVIGAIVWGKPEAMLAVVVPTVPILPLLLVYLLLAANAVNKERYQGMMDAAEQLGFLHTANVSRSLLEQSAGFHLTAGQTHLSNEIRGEQDGVAAVVFTCCTRCYQCGIQIRGGGCVALGRRVRSRFHFNSQDGCGSPSQPWVVNISSSTDRN